MQTKQNLISAAEQLEQAAQANAAAGLTDMASGQFSAAMQLRSKAAQMPDEPQQKSPIPKEGTREWDIYLETLRQG